MSYLEETLTWNGFLVGASLALVLIWGAPWAVFAFACIAAALSLVIRLGFMWAARDDSRAREGGGSASNSGRG